MEKVLDKAKSTKKVKTDEVSAPVQQKAEEEDAEAGSWIVEGIIVKIKDKGLDKYYNQKGKILEVVEPFIAQVEMLNTKAKLQIDQDLLETVIPVKNICIIYLKLFRRLEILSKC